MRTVPIAAAALLAVAGPVVAGDLGESVSFRSTGTTARFAAPAPGDSKVVFETGASEPTKDSWDTFLIQGELADPSIALEAARVNEPSPIWRALTMHVYPGGRFWAKGRFPAGTGQVAVRGISLESIKGLAVTLYSTETFLDDAGADDKDGEGDKRRRGRRSPRPTRPEVPARRHPPTDSPEAPAPETTAAPRPSVHARSEWHARPPKDQNEDIKPWRLTLHHTETRYTDNLQDSLREAKIIQDFHMDGRGWSDIAYHFLIDGAGNIIEGRPEGIKGAHAGNQELNAGNVGIVMIGSYHPPTNNHPTADQLEAFAELGRYFVQKYGIKPANLKGHRDWKSTDCPGDILYAQLPQLRRAIGFIVQGLAKVSPIRLPERLLSAVDWNGRAR